MLLLDVLYVAAFIVLSPWILAMIIFRPSFRAGIGARFRPALHAEPSRPTVWLHGSSAGEIDLLRALAGQVETLPGDYRIVISAFAVSGYTAAKKAFPQHTVIYFPVDFSPVVRRFLRVIQPKLIVLVESELWPNFIATSDRAGIPVCAHLGTRPQTVKMTGGYKSTGRSAEEAKRLKELENENKRLKKLLAEAELDKAILKDALEGNY